jgi:hypothetical protein
MTMYLDKQLVGVRITELKAEAAAERLAQETKEGRRSTPRWSLARVFQQVGRRLPVGT